MSHICIIMENHPDRCIEETYGPFPDHTEADTFGRGYCYDIRRTNGDHRLYTWTIRELISPEDV